MANLVDLYLVYRILRLFTTPFTEWEAFKTGVIDLEGNIVVPSEKRTPAQDDSFTKFDLLILKLKRVLEKLPFGKTRLASYAAALFLLKEEKNIKAETLEDLVKLRPELQDVFSQNSVVLMKNGLFYKEDGTKKKKESITMLSIIGYSGVDRRANAVIFKLKVSPGSTSSTYTGTR